MVLGHHEHIGASTLEPNVAFIHERAGDLSGRSFRLHRVDTTRDERGPTGNTELHLAAASAAYVANLTAVKGDARTGRYCCRGHLRHLSRLDRSVRADDEIAIDAPVGHLDDRHPVHQTQELDAGGIHLELFLVRHELYGLDVTALEHAKT